MSTLEAKKQQIKDGIKSYNDFPKPGVVFRDIFSVLQNPDLFSLLRELLITCTKSLAVQPDIIVGLDSRGFLFGTLIALDLKLPFIPVRKKGKLPGPTKAVTYSLEYGTDTLEISSNVIEKGKNVLIVDDLLATGGTLRTACQLVEQVGGDVCGCLIVIELLELKGRSQFNYPVLSIAQY